MNILFVSINYNPKKPPFNGDSQRTRLLYEVCTRIADVDQITLKGDYIVRSHQSNLQKWMAVLPFTRLSSLFPVNSGWEAIIDETIRKKHYDYIVTRYFNRAMACGLWKYRDKLVVDFDDALPFFFLNQINESSARTTRFRFRLAALKAKSRSRRVVRKIHTAFFAKKETAVANRGIFLPNIPFYGDSCADVLLDSSHRRILFVGQLGYEPNKEGLDYFLNQVYIPLTHRLPDVEMHIVGRTNDELCKRWQRYPKVIVTGFVEDLRKEYEESHVVVIPILRCGATNIKILEAMSMNRACVATKEAYDSFREHFVDKKDLYVADSAESFIESVFTLLTDETENRRVAHNAKRAMENYHSFDTFASIIKTAFL